jgi:DNA-binding XRE family transcriptional regulator
MDLKEYLEKKHIIKKGFASELGVTEATLHNILSNRKKPSPKTAQKIVELTNGEVTFEDLFKKKEKE